MTQYFQRSFSNLDDESLHELATLESEGAVYAYLWSDDHERFVFARLQLTPSEIVAYVDALTAYDQFLGELDATGEPHLALAALSNQAIRRRVEAYNEWTCGIGQHDTQFCLAAFLGEDLEALTCSIVAHRHEILGLHYTANRRYLLREILDLLPDAATAAAEHGGFVFPRETEPQLRSLVFLVLKCVFPDARLEDPSPKHAGTAKRIDIVLPSLSIVLELKFVRNAQHARTVADELKVDIESYHVHPGCKSLLAFVWDPQRLLADRQNFIADLQGPREKSGKRFTVEIIVKP